MSDSVVAAASANEDSPLGGVADPLANPTTLTLSLHHAGSAGGSSAGGSSASADGGSAGVSGSGGGGASEPAASAAGATASAAGATASAAGATSTCQALPFPSLTCMRGRRHSTATTASAWVSDCVAWRGTLC